MITVPGLAVRAASRCEPVTFLLAPSLFSRMRGGEPSMRTESVRNHSVAHRTFGLQ